MSHSDPAALALAALGEPLTEAGGRHLDSCSTCSEEVAELADVVLLAREAPAELPPVPDRVWAGIRSELDQDLAATLDEPTPAPVSTPAPETSTGPSRNAAAPASPARRSPWGRFALAAMAGAVVGGAVVWSAIDRGAAETDTADTFLAQAVLAPLDDSVAAAGEASVVTGEDGQVVRVDARSLPDNDGFYEVWLLNPDATKLVALGALPAGSIGTFTLPPGLSLEDFPVVDISLETYDGDPTHSTNSLMRGVLEA